MFANHMGRLHAGTSHRPVPEARFAILKRAFVEIDNVGRATWRDRLHRLRLKGRAVQNVSTLAAWAQPENPSDVIRVNRHLLMPIQPTRPYINTDWTVSKRLDVVKTHYRLASLTMRALELPNDGRKTLLALDGILPSMALVLDRPLWFSHEGECVLNLFLDNLRVVSLAFSAGVENEQPVAYLGAVQGGSVGAHMMDINRSITHEAHGLRPRDLLINLFRMLCAHCGMNEILLVSNATAVAYSPYFGQRAIRTNYDEIAHDHCATPDTSGRGYCMTAKARRRELSEIPSKRRSMHRQRYQMLDELDGVLGAVLGTSPPSATQAA